MSVLRITEIADDDGTVTGPLTFEWSIKNRAAPQGDWEQPREVRVTRTYYPDSSGVPSEQVGGSNLGQQTLEGVLDDRHMGAGVALEHAKAFDKMVSRLNRVKIEYDHTGYVARIDSFVPNVRRSNFIPWRLTFTPHWEIAAPPQKTRGGLAGQSLPRTPDEYYQGVLLSFSSGEQLHDDAALWQLGGTVFLDVGTKIAEASATVDEIQRVLDLRTNAQVNATTTIKNVADLMARVETRTAAVTATLTSTSSDTAAMWQSPLTVLGFEAWGRGVAADMRIAGLRAHTARIELARKVDPEVLAIYQPRAGESLMAISLQFYGNAYQWRTIADRNRLAYTNLQGTEALVIPRLAREAA